MGLHLFSLQMIYIYLIFHSHLDTFGVAGALCPFESSNNVTADKYAFLDHPKAPDEYSAENGSLVPLVF